MRIVRAAFALAVLMVLAGCSGYQAGASCYKEVGPAPNWGLPLTLGLVGVLAQQSDPAWREWNERRGACLERRLAERR